MRWSSRTRPPSSPRPSLWHGVGTALRATSARDRAPSSVTTTCRALRRERSCTGCYGPGFHNASCRDSASKRCGLEDSNMIVVRLATLDDAEVIERQTSSVQQLHNEALPFIFKPPSADLFPAQRLAALIEDPNCIVAVAEIGGK